MASYDVNYDDKRFAEVEADKKAALNEVDVTYGNMISQSDKYYDKQIQASKDWADKQSQLQQEKTDFAIEQIEQQKDQTKKDYTKEQSGAYVDWQKQSDPYGVNAEKMAAQGMQNTGYSESSQVNMYVAYQNRVATAREAYSRAVLNFNNSIQQARLQNNSILAEIAAEALQKQLELSLQGFQYKNELLREQTAKKTALESEYYARYQDVLAQINHENSMAEQIRQFNENKAMQEKQLAEEKRQFDETMAFNKSKYSGGGSGGSGGSGNKTIGRTSTSALDKVKKYISGKTVAAKVSGSSSSGSSSSGSSSSGSSSKPDVDMDSVLNLGFGPISESRLLSLERSGVVESYVSGGKVKFRKTASTNKAAKLFGF